MGKINGSLEAMANGLDGKNWCHNNVYSLADIAVGCALGYLDFRFPQIDWRARHPSLDKLYTKLAVRPSFIDTAPPKA
jgi:glutathione S-transferase